MQYLIFFSTKLRWRHWYRYRLTTLHPQCQTQRSALVVLLFVNVEAFRNIPKPLKSILQVWLHESNSLITCEQVLYAFPSLQRITYKHPKFPAPSTLNCPTRSRYISFFSVFAFDKSWRALCLTWAVRTGSKKTFLCDRASLFGYRSMLGLNFWMQQRNKKLQHIWNVFHTLRNFFFLIWILLEMKAILWKPL